MRSLEEKFAQNPSRITQPPEQSFLSAVVRRNLTAPDMRGAGPPPVPNSRAAFLAKAIEEDKKKAEQEAAAEEAKKFDAPPKPPGTSEDAEGDEPDVAKVRGEIWPAGGEHRSVVVVGQSHQPPPPPIPTPSLPPNPQKSMIKEDRTYDIYWLTPPQRKVRIIKSRREKYWVRTPPLPNLSPATP